jgi:hypothetical protein
MKKLTALTAFTFCFLFHQPILAQRDYRSHSKRPKPAGSVYVNVQPGLGIRIGRVPANAPEPAKDIARQHRVALMLDGEIGYHWDEHRVGVRYSRFSSAASTNLASTGPAVLYNEKVTINWIGPLYTYTSRITPRSRLRYDARMGVGYLMFKVNAATQGQTFSADGATVSVLGGISLNYTLTENLGLLFGVDGNSGYVVLGVNGTDVEESVTLLRIMGGLQFRF